MKIALPLLFIVLASSQIFEPVQAGPPTTRPPLTCATILCITGYSCIDNKCVKNPEFPPGITCANVRCKGGYRCLDNPTRCVKIGKCETIDCRPNYLCVEPGKCVRDRRCDTVKCSKGYICIAGKCERIFIHPNTTTPPEV